MTKQSISPRQAESASSQSKADQPAAFGEISHGTSIWKIPGGDWICLGILLLVTMMFFWKGFSQKGRVDMVREDAAYFYQPYYQYAADEITSGRFPHWNPYSSCGAPYHAVLQGAVLYPLRWPMFFMNYPLAYALAAGVHFFLAGAFTYLFIRVTLKCCPLASLIGAISFAFGGFTMGHVAHFNFFLAYPWLVLTVFLLSQAMERSRWTWAVAAGIPIGMMGLIGAIHLMLVMGFVLAGWVVGESIVKIVQTLRKKQKSTALIFWPAAAVGIALVIGGAIGMAQIWPAQLQSSLSSRGEVGWDFITEICSHPIRTPLRLAAHFYYGNYRLGYWGDNNFHEQCFYAGIVPLAAAIIAVALCWRNRWVKRLVVLCIVGSVVAAGRYLPVYRWLYDYVPQFDRLRNPARFFVWVQFGIACLGAIGLNMAMQKAKRLSGRLPMIVSLLVGAVVVIVIVGSLVSLHRLAQDPSAGLELVGNQENLNQHDRMQHTQAVQTMPRRVMQKGDTITWIGILAAILSAGVCSAFFASQRMRTETTGWLLVVLLIVDLGVFSAGTHIHSDVLGIVTDHPQHVRFLQANLGLQRYVGWRGHHSQTDRHRGMLFRIRHAVAGPGGIMHTPRQAKMIGLIFGANRPTADLAGVRYLVTGQPVRGENLTVAYSRYPAFIAENKQAFPRAFLTRRTRTFGDANEVLGTIITGRENLHDVALLERQIDPLPYPPGSKAGTVSDIRDLPGEYRMRIDAPAPRQLVLTETHHPQWKCTIDGEPTEIYQTDYFFMSVRVPPGRHEVHWWFEPTRFKQGLAVTLASSAFVLAAIGLSWLHRRRKLEGRLP